MMAQYLFGFQKGIVRPLVLKDSLVTLECWKSGQVKTVKTSEKTSLQNIGKNVGKTQMVMISFQNEKNFTGVVAVLSNLLALLLK